MKPKIKNQKQESKLNLQMMNRMNKKMNNRIH